MIASESTLERDLFILLEFDPMIESYEEQPETLSYLVRQEERRTYTPDVLFYFKNNPDFLWFYSPFRRFFEGTSLREIDRNHKGRYLIPKNRIPVPPTAILGEVKYREDLFSKWRENKPKFRAAQRFADAKGWEFRIFTEKEIRTPLLDNIKFIRQYKRYQFPQEKMIKVIDQLERIGRCSLSELLDGLAVTQMDRGQLIPLIWHLVSIHEIDVNWEKPITLASTLSYRT